MIGRAALCVWGLAAFASLAGAQEAPTIRLQVRVADSAGVRIAGADVAITHGLRDVVAHGSTDASGGATLTAPRSGDSYNVVVRKIGFNRADAFVKAGGDSVQTLEVRLTRAVTSLPAVSVTAAENARRRAYQLTADDIASTSRTIIDGTDLFKLRPEMLNSHGGPTACKVEYTDHDGWIESVWVNGHRVNLVLLDPIALSRRTAVGLAPIPAPGRTRGARGATMPGELPPHAQPKLDTVLTILRSIRPEHIAEVSYKDCFDTSVGLNHSDMAMFIVLKPGIGFEPGRGSYVLDDTRSAGAAAMPDVRTVDSTSINVASYPPYRFRIIGLFDESSGGTVEGAEIVDLRSGLRIHTSATGTASLFFLPDGGSTILVRKPGLRDTTFFVPITPADTAPITLLLRKP